MTVYTSFWIRSGNPQTYFYRGQIQFEDQEYAQSAQSTSIAAQSAETSPHYKNEPSLRVLSAEAHFYLGIIDHLRGKDGEAIEEYQKALEANRDFPDASDIQAWSLATSSDPSLRDGPKAVQLAEHACELTQYGDASLIDTLAAADAEAGRFDEAVATIQRAIYVAQQNNDKAMVEQNEQFLELYRAHKPYHEVALVPAAK
jgi:tetratricopeptide (TPR) repeat protein